jgi:Fic family protein
MPIAWNDDPPASAGRIVANSRALLHCLAAEAGHRQAPSVAAAQDWHRAIYDGVALPVAYYAGEVRDDDERFPELIGYEVAVGPNRGLPSSEVPAALAAFERQAREACARLDEVIAASALPADDRELHGVLALCAALHGEWVRIHPFANGIGRTARLWANWAALRYGLPPFVRLRPRPEGLAYAAAAHASMVGDHALAIGVFRRQLTDLLDSLPA